MSYFGGNLNNNGRTGPGYEPVPFQPQQYEMGYAPGGPTYLASPGPISPQTPFYYSASGRQSGALSYDPLLNTPSHPSSAHASDPPPNRSSTLALGPLQLAHNYRKLKQFRRLFGRILLRWLISAVFCAGIAGLFIYYEGDGVHVLDSDQKHWFNAGYLGLSLMLGLSLVSSFKSMADIFRWKVLASVRYGGHTAHEVDLVLGLSSYQSATQLIKHWMNKPRYLSLLILWIALGIGAQVGVALLGLTFNHESDGAQQSSPGKVDITDLGAFYDSKEAAARDSIPGWWIQNYRAHLYGEVSNIVHSYGDPQTSMEKLGLLPEELDVEIHARERNESPEYRYYFKEYILPQRDMISKSDRYISISASCRWSPIIKNPLGNTMEVVAIDYNGDGSGANNDTQDWMLGLTAAGGILYNNPSVNMNGTELAEYNANGTIYKNPTCGERCGRVNVYRFLESGKDWDGVSLPAPFGDFYECDVEVSPVVNAVLPEHKMPDNVAVRVASAIGSSAIYHTTTGYQAQVYNPASQWFKFEKTGRQGTAIAEDHVARFAIGAVAQLDMSNPSVHVDGNRPWRGVILKVRWIFVWVTFGLILGAQGIVGIIVIIKTNNVFCKDQSYLSSARLLRSAMDQLGDQGTAASGDEIAKAFKGRRMRYGVGQSAAGRQVLEILVDEAPRPQESKMQTGLYE